MCVCRDRHVGVFCVAGGWSPSAGGPGHWDFDVLHQKKTTCKEVKWFPLSISEAVETELLIFSIFNSSRCVCYSAGGSSRPQDSRTRCFDRAAHATAPVSGRHSSASPRLWSLRPLSPANLCSLPLPDRTLEHWSPAEQLQRWDTLTPILCVRVRHYTSICGSCSWHLYPCHRGLVSESFP